MTDSLKQSLDKLENIKIFKNSFLVFPLVARSPETGWTGGLASAYIFKTKKSDSTLRTSTIPSGILYTERNQIVAGIGGSIFFPKEKYILRFENTFSKFPDKFWGLGNFTPDNQKESYTFTQLYFNPQLMRKVYRNYFVGLSYEFQRVFQLEYEANGLFDQNQITGRYGGVISGAGLVLNYDNRNHAYWPDKGALLRIRYTVFGQYLSSNFNFYYIDLDFRKFKRVYKNQILCFQGYTIFNFGDPAFRNLATLGGNGLMRGYYSGRYRDKNMVAVQAEYRVPIWKRFSAVGFVGFGQVFPEVSEFRFHSFKYSLGTGIRVAVLPREKLNLRFDYGFGNEGSSSYYVVLAESF